MRTTGIRLLTGPSESDITLDTIERLTPGWRQYCIDLTWGGGGGGGGGPASNFAS